MDVILDTYQFCQDCDRHYRYRDKREFRNKLNTLKSKEGRVISIWYKIENLVLNCKLNDINNEKKELKELKIRVNYRSTRDDISPMYEQGFVWTSKKKE